MPIDPLGEKRVSTNVVHIPATFGAEQIAALKEVNKGAAFVFPLQPGEAVRQELHRSAWLTILDWLKPLLKIGATIYVPGPLGAAVGTALAQGIDAIEARLSGEPLKEKWTVEEIRAAKAAIVDPRT